MFSRRLAWSSPPNRLARLLRERRAAGADILDLTESNPTRAGLPYPAEAIAAALADPGVAVHEPEPRGSREARRAVAACYARRGLAVDPERIVLTASTSEAYALLFKMLADPGDSILVPRPGYPLFEYLAALESVRVVDYPIVHDGRWGIDLGALERAVAGAPAPPRALVVVNPNNPTGSALRAPERDALEAIGARHGLPIISDEVFFDYLFAVPGAAGGGPGGGTAGDPIVSLLPGVAAGPAPCRAEALAFVLGGLSKSCGLPQMKLAWIVVAGPDRPAAEALERLELVADTYLSVGAPVQRAAVRLLDLGAGIRRAIRERIAGNLEHLAGAAGARPSCRLLAGDGGWSAVLQVPSVVPEEELVLRLLAEDEVLVHPGYFFDFPREAYLVVSLLPPPGDFREGVRRLLERAGP